LGEGYYQQEGEEHLYPGQCHPELVEKLDKLAVAVLLLIFAAAQFVRLGVLRHVGYLILPARSGRSARILP
jgi:hypothetical protein